MQTNREYGRERFLAMNMLEQARNGWPHAGPWEWCYDQACEARLGVTDENGVVHAYPEHVYSEIRSPDGRVRMCIHIDAEREKITVLTIRTMT